MARVSTIGNPAVSVILPTFNRGHTILQAIQSVLALRHEIVEIIVVDDGSSDDTLDIIAGLEDPRLSVVSLKSNRGAGFARNTGIGLARAPYVAFIDSDDVWLADRLELPLSMLRSHPNVGVVLSAFTTEKRGKQTHYEMPDRIYGGSELESLVARHVLQPTTSGLTFRKDLLSSVGGFNTELRWMEDYDLVMRVARRTDGATINKPLWHKRWQPDGVSSHHNTYLPSLLTFLASHSIYSDRELEFRNYLVARHLAKTAYYSGLLSAMRDYSEARQRLSPELPPLSVLMMKHFRTRRSRRAQKRELLGDIDKGGQVFAPFSALAGVAMMAAEVCQSFI